MLPEKWTVRLSNALLGIALNAAMRPEYRPVTMRWTMRWGAGAGASRKRLARRFPQARFTPTLVAGLPAEVISTQENPKRTLLYLHGGGFFTGDIKSYRRNALRLAYRSGARVVLVEYRLAPENPFPAALDDAKAAVKTLAQEYGAENLVLGGDSAGGGLTIATLLALRDEGGPLPARAFVISAFADMTASGASYDSNRKKDVWLSRRHIAKWAPWYAQREQFTHPYVSPVFGDFRGLPPLLFLVGEHEVLLDDTLRMAEKARSAGVSTEVVIGKQMQHDWMFAVTWLRESKMAMRSIAHFVGA